MGGEKSQQSRTSQDIAIWKILEHTEQSSFSTSCEDYSKNDNTCAYSPPHVSLPPHSDKGSISPSDSSSEVSQAKQKNPGLYTALDCQPICIDREATAESLKSYDGKGVRMGELTGEERRGGWGGG